MCSDNCIRRYQLHDGDRVATLQAEYADALHDGIYKLVAAPSGMMFATTCWDDGEDVVALDPLTLEYRYRFGSDILHDVYGLAVVGDELFVCDRTPDPNDEDGAELAVLQVFRLSGEHRREVRVDRFGVHPTHIVHCDGRLYLRSSEDSNAIHVLTDDGSELLHTYVPKEQGLGFEICLHERRLITGRSHCLTILRGL